MIFPRKCLGCPPFLGYIFWPKVVGALLLLLAPLPYFLSGVPVCNYSVIFRNAGKGRQREQALILLFNWGSKSAHFRNEIGPFQNVSLTEMRSN